MSDQTNELEGPDLGSDVAASTLTEGAMLAGHVNGEAVLLVRRNNQFFAVGARCTHYGAPLAGGLLVDETVRCSWHHACFGLRTGEALRAPALNPVTCWRVERSNDSVYVREKLESAPRPPSPLPENLARSIVIVGGGAAGNAAAELLRRESYSGSITMLSADAALPCDRPNLSKGYLAGLRAKRRIRSARRIFIGNAAST